MKELVLSVGLLDLLDSYVQRDRETTSASVF